MVFNGKTGNNHPKPIRLFDISQESVKPNLEEQQHIRQCEECQTVIAIFARQFSLKNQPKDKPENAA